MDNNIKLIKPYIELNDIKTELEGVFESGMFTKGIHVEKFQDALKSYTGAKHCFLTTSATTALSMCLQCLGIKRGDKVAVSDYSWPATAHVVEEVGAIPVFIDVDIDTYNMKSSSLLEVIEDDIKAVIFVDALGNPSGIEDIADMCRRHKIPLIEDSACGLGSSVSDRKVGNIADLTCFSFHPRKLITTGEGGAIMTNNSNYASWMKVKLAVGVSGVKNNILDFTTYGYNYRLSEIQALMGWKQVEKLNLITEERNYISNLYDKRLSPYGFIRQKKSEDVYHNIQSLVFKVPKHLERDSLINHLASHNVEATIGTYCLSSTTYYSKKYNSIQKISSELEKCVITFPCYKDVDVDKITKLIIDFSQNELLESYN
jgi:dTDP-4-amino-4,6-dideoxygalactose transaminase